MCAKLCMDVCSVAVLAYIPGSVCWLEVGGGARPPLGISLASPLYPSGTAGRVSQRLMTGSAGVSGDFVMWEFVNKMLIYSIHWALLPPILPRAEVLKRGEPISRVICNGREHESQHASTSGVYIPQLHNSKYLQALERHTLDTTPPRTWLQSCGDGGHAAPRSWVRVTVGRPNALNPDTKLRPLSPTTYRTCARRKKLK